MTLTEEYLRQAEFRHWGTYINQLPANSTSQILDLGCGVGTVTKLLANKYSHVIGVDKDKSLIAEAIKRFPAKNIHYLSADLRRLQDCAIPSVDGIWCSFTAAYFTDFDKIFPNWMKLLKPGGWIALVEANDLFNHQPVSEATQNAFSAHYQRLMQERQYDFMMGGKLKGYSEQNHLRLIKEQLITDPELTTSGAAPDVVVTAWADRLTRMTQFKQVLGKKRFEMLKADFLNGLRQHEHRCNARIHFVIAKLTSSN